MKTSPTVVFFIALLIVSPAGDRQVAGQQPAKRLNVLFIAIDDLRPALGCYGDVVAITPNIDRLAARGTVFRRAYCQQAVCSPSRLSLMTGRRPDAIRVWDLNTHFRAAIPDLVTLPQHFKDHGYHTQSVGKIYHGNGKPSKDPPSWSVEPKYDRVRDPQLRYALPGNLQGSGLKRAASEAAEVADDHYIDGIVCESAVRTLAAFQTQNQPFFLAVGFRKPHLPFCAPMKYWDLYERAKIPLPIHNQHPVAAPELATRSWMELEGYTDIPDDGVLTTEMTRELRHGYYACVSYIDALLGRLLDQLDRSRLTGNTVIVLWGDHGYHLGEQGLWTKANNYELSTRVPLIIADPRQTTVGQTCEALVELVDLYSTLSDACGLDPPAGVSGDSLMPLLGDPNQAWQPAVFSQFPRALRGSRHQSHGAIMGYAVRTDRYRYVEWRQWESQQVVARELYDHEFDLHETQNVASHSEQATVINELATLLSSSPAVLDHSDR